MLSITTSPIRSARITGPLFRDMNMRLARALSTLALVGCLAFPAYANDIGNSTWSPSAASNNATPPNGWPSVTMLPNQVAPTAREMMAAIKRWYQRINPVVTSGGAADVQTLTFDVAPAAYVLGDQYTFIAGFTNTGSATLEINGLGPLTIKIGTDALIGSEIIAGRTIVVYYDGTDFQLVTPAGNKAHPGLSTTADVVRYDIGGYPFNNEFFGSAGAVGAGWKGVQGFVSTVLTPAGAATLCGSAPCQDVAIAAYAQTLSASRFALAVFGEAGIGVSGGYAMGGNFPVVNCKNHDATCTDGGGYDAGQIIGVEVDVSVYSKSGGGTPTGGAYGFAALLNAPTVSLSSGTVGYIVHKFNTLKWDVGFATADASATVAYVVGAAAITPGSASQTMIFNSYDAGGVLRQGQFIQNYLGALSWTNNVSGASFTWASSFPDWLALGTNAGGSVGMDVRNLSSAASSKASYNLGTGTAGSTANFTLFDSDQLIVATGAAVTGGVVLAPAAGGITVTGLPTDGGGSGLHFLCINSVTGKVYRGTGATCN